MPLATLQLSLNCLADEFRAALAVLKDLIDPPQCPCREPGRGLLLVDLLSSHAGKINDITYVDNKKIDDIIYPSEREMDMAYYTREIQMPKTKREGLENFVQMIINRIEAGEAQEALLQAVDLLDSVRCGQYDDAMADAKGYSAMAREMATKHQAEIINAGEAGYARGVADEKARMAKALGLAA